MNDSAAGRVQRSMRGSPQKRRRNGRPTPLDLLLDDPATVYAAAAAFALAERPRAAAWPIVASVGPDTVTLRWAGGASTVPEPEAPWRVGHDARVWIADRDEIGDGGPEAAQTSASTVLVIGQFKDSVVFVNTSRAPGPIVVGGGSGGEAGLLRELVTRQGADGGDGVGQRGAWWPVEVEGEGEAVVLLGLAVARMFSADEVRSAAELMERAMAQEPERRRESEAVGDDAEQTEANEQTEAEQTEANEQTETEQTEADEQTEINEDRDPAKRVEKQAELVDLEVDLEAVQAATQTPRPATGGLAERLRKAKQAAARVEPELEPEPEPVPAQTSALRPPQPVAEPQTVYATVSAPSSAEPTVPVHTPAPAKPAPADADPAEPDPDDWAAGFAVSSRTSPEPTN